ncbi:MAG: baseplate J/gp47 family protein [Rubrivivax sp.]|nr:baseplate J/gp47 family protein [Rubrivivax sp.]
MIDGTEQRQRLPAAWADGGFKVDEMSLDRLVEACARLGERLRFVDLNGHEQGNWEPWFDGDETLVLARIASIDRYGRQQAFLAKAGSAPLAELAHHVFELAQLLNSWLQALSGRGQPAAAVHEAILQLIERPLGGQLKWLAERVSAASWDGRSLLAMHQGLQPLWHGPREETLPPAETLRREHLRGMFFTFLAAVAQVRTLAREHLRDTLPSGRHEPAAGLLLAFLHLYESVQHEINRFTDRHIDFYYRRCLGLQPRALLPDRVSVACRLDPLAPPALDLPAGTTFVAGKNIAGQPLLFRSLEAVTLSGARVASLCTLRLERDRRIEPEADLHYVTGIKAHRLGLPAPDASAVPTFGGGPGSNEATLGLAVATPMLLLKEGAREIELNLRLSWPQQARRMARQRTAAPGLTVRDAEHASQLCEAPEGLFGLWLLSDDVDALAAEDQQRLERLAQGPRDRAFFNYANALFEVALTHEHGWFVAERVQVARTPRGSSGSGGLQLRVHLRPEDPAIVGCDARVHGAQWPTRLPLLRLQVNPRARIHPYSLLEGARLVEAEMRVRVRGAKDILLHNNFGPLDATKTFSPFGPLPTTSSYLVFGSPEAARKSLDTLALRVEWGGLPQEPGGFVAHYGGYGPEQRAGSFAAALSILRDGQWRSCGGRSAAQPLFAALDAQERLPGRQRIEVDGDSVRQHAWASDVPLTAIGPGTRNGLLRLQLTHPRGAFGHAEYPSLLADALSARARRRRSVSLPNAPYTPVIESISLDYSASARIRPDAERRGGAAPDGERLMHIHPFGVAELRSNAQTPHHGVLPALGPDGNLYIGLRADRLDGPLNLLFQLRETDATGLDALTSRSALQWSCLEANQWRPLPPHCVLSDGTQGMLTSGVVRLDLPNFGTNTNTVLEGGFFWLRVARSERPEAVARLVAVHAQALTLEREVGSAGAADAPLPAQRITQPVVAQAGLAGVLQPEPSTGWRPAEDERQFRMRAGERLRHKNRASLGWDIERLVLEAFPEVFKVKCLSAQESELGPGGLRVVVVPWVRLGVPEDSLRAPRFDASHLMRIQDFVAERSSPFARVLVCNAVYERVQVRCRVRLERGEQAGSVLRRINRTLVEFLSPWHDVGRGAQFGWLLRCDEVQAVVRAVPGVAAVGGVSLLHLVEDSPNHFVLHDTARPGFAGANTARAAAPWSLALPMAEHLLSVAPNDVAIRPRGTGVSLLNVGSTFVVS